MHYNAKLYIHNKTYIFVFFYILLSNCRAAMNPFVLPLAHLASRPACGTSCAPYFIILLNGIFF